MALAEPDGELGPFVGDGPVPERDEPDGLVVRDLAHHQVEEGPALLAEVDGAPEEGRRRAVHAHIAVDLGVGPQALQRRLVAGRGVRRETLRPLRLALRRHVFWGMESRHAWPAGRLVPAGQRIGSILARADGPADRPRGRTGPRVAGMWRSFASLFLTFIALGWATIISALCFFYGAPVG